MNDAGFDGTIKWIGKKNLRFRHGYDVLQLKEYLHYQPYNHLFWCEKEKMFLYRNKEGKFFKLNFEEFEL
jgi:hypothetical protein